MALVGTLEPDLARETPIPREHRHPNTILHEPPSGTLAPHVDPLDEPTLASSATNAMPSEAELLRHLRGRVLSQSSPHALRHTLQAMVNQQSPAARCELLSALEYPGSGTRLAEFVSSGGLPELLQWLRPTDAAMALTIAARVARLSENASDSTSRRQEDMGRLSSMAGDCPGNDPGNDAGRSEATGREADTGTDTRTLPPAVNAFLLTELFEEGRPFDPEPFAKRLTSALEVRESSSTTATVDSGRRPTEVLTQTHRVATDRSPASTRTHANHTAESNPSRSTAAEAGRAHAMGTESVYSAVARSAHATGAGSTHAAFGLSPVRTVSPLQDAAINQRIYIANAGVVLIAPYLPRLFSMLELTHETAFSSTSCAHRAVHLVQYIVTGCTTTPEPLLVLNKILCGLPISEPVPLDIDLRAKERTATEEMLTAIIAHWQAIGRTSIAGLRESFLQREGRLACAEETWQLRVESKCFDMLLDRLPWGYATVKFPWMKRVLRVVWR